MQKILLYPLLFAVVPPLCLNAQTKPGWHWGLEMGLSVTTAEVVVFKGVVAKMERL